MHLYSPTKRRDGGLGLGLGGEPYAGSGGAEEPHNQQAHNQQAHNQQQRPLSIQSLLNASVSGSASAAQWASSSASSSSPLAAGRTGGIAEAPKLPGLRPVLSADDIAGNYYVHQQPGSGGARALAVSDSHAPAAARAGGGSAAGWGANPLIQAADKLGGHGGSPRARSPPRHHSLQHAGHAPPPPIATAASLALRRSVSFHGANAAAPLPRHYGGGAAHRVARTGADALSPGGELRYRPYPEMAQAEGSGDELGGRAAKGDSLARRRRRTQACEYCHLKKIKCEGDGQRCINCIKNDVQCMWGLKRKRGPKPKTSLAGIAAVAALATEKAQPARNPNPANPANPANPPSPLVDDADARMAPSQSPPTERGEGLRAPAMEAEIRSFFSDAVVARETREAVRFYFDYFYPLCPMFHPSMFIRRVVQGDVDPLLIDAMRAAGARVVARVTGRAVDGVALARSVKQRILEQLERPTVDLVRVLVIMTLLAGSQGEMMSYNSLICLAASLVVRLGWHKMDLYKRAPPAAWDEWVALEVQRRVFWLVYQTDSYQAMLTGRPMSIAEDSVFVSAPCSDFEWDQLAPGAAALAATRATPPASVPASARRRESPASSSASAASLRVDQHAIVATGAFSYSFMALCELTAIIARMNTFLCDAKAGRLAALPTAAAAAAAASSAGVLRDGPFPAVDFMGPAPVTGSLVVPVVRTVSLLSEYPAFVDLDERLEEWRRNLLMPEDLRDDATPAADITYFGNADHRRFMMRVRYFCLHCYYVPITLFLHQSNRPSFFTEYEQPLEERLQAKQQWASDDDEEGRAADAALRQMLSAAFASTWNEGLLAYDVEERSWHVCLLAAHGLSEHLERNSDFPLERFDQVIPFCIFMSVSVLIRQVRMCSRLLEEASAAGSATLKNKEEGGRFLADARLRLAAQGGYLAVTSDRTRCIKHVRQQWATLQRLGSLWNIEGMEHLLRSMQIDEVANAADMFSGMSL
ncbi:hypothetical protein GGI02_004198 [Coemansia sp. RSA 2322]|nr:hypothetical protein GGI02_004198 [Coemansia sp. RSA 2322]